MSKNNLLIIRADKGTYLRIGAFLMLKMKAAASSFGKVLNLTYIKMVSKVIDNNNNKI